MTRKPTRLLLTLALLSFALVPLVGTPTTVAAAACAPGQTTYVIKTGDTLYRIGRTFGVSWQTIATLNNLPNPNLIYIGAPLCIPPGGTPAPLPTPTAMPQPTVAPQPTVMPQPTVAPPVYTGYPAFAIVNVVRSQSVTIRGNNFPANTAFEVLMGNYGTLGVGGTTVQTLNSGAGGVFTATYAIPAVYSNTAQIAIRLQSASGYYAYNWFYNATAP